MTRWIKEISWTHQGRRTPKHRGRNLPEVLRRSGDSKLQKTRYSGSGLTSPVRSYKSGSVFHVLKLEGINSIPKIFLVRNPRLLPTSDTGYFISKLSVTQETPDWRGHSRWTQSELTPFFHYLFTCSFKTLGVLFVPGRIVIPFRFTLGFRSMNWRRRVKGVDIQLLLEMGYSLELSFRFFLS